MRLIEENMALQQSVEQLERKTARQTARISRLDEQIENLKGFGPRRPADLFAPVRIEIDRLSGGADYDGNAGDDGVTVYLQPRDEDGHVIKAPGRIKVQLLDNSDLENPRLIGLCLVEDAKDLRPLWYGRFFTNHYVIRCPFFPGSEPPRRVTVSVEFLDYLTGRTLTAVREVDVGPAPK